MELVYSSEPVDAEGKRVLNPRHFDRPKPGATKVIIHGDWPRVAQSYREVGVEVAQVRKTPSPLVAPQIARETAEIPDDWRELGWPDLRKLASSVSQEPVINKVQAIAAIEAELERRGRTED